MKLSEHPFSDFSVHLFNCALVCSFVCLFICLFVYLFTINDLAFFVLLLSLLLTL